MKKLFLLSTLPLLIFSTITAQIRLDIAGDAKISGKISLIKTQGDSSLFIGANAGINDDGGNQNIFIGKNAGSKNTSGEFNTFYGHNSGVQNVTGNFNTFIGYETGKVTTTQSFLTFIGHGAGRSNTTGFSNVFIGATAGANNTIGAGNIFVGTNAGFSNTTGDGNVFLGNFSGSSNTQGRDNIIIGSEAGRVNTLGKENIFIGTYAGRNNTEGNSNTYMGFRAAENGSKGEYNTSLGYYAGRYQLDGTSNTYLGALSGISIRKGNKNTFIGHKADVEHSIDSLENATAIGYEAKVACHNCAIIGGSGNNAVRVGIGVSTTWSDLHIKQSSTINGNSGVRLEYKTNGKHWNTYIDSADDYNFRYNDALKAYIKDEDGMYTIPSDGRLKKKVENIGTTLDKIMRLRPVKYFYKNAARSKYKTHGFIAQEVEGIFPAFVSEKDGFKALAYDNFAIISIKAIQELKQTIDEQATSINQQKETVDELKSEIAALRLLVEQLMTPVKAEGAVGSEIHSSQKASLSQNAPNPVHQRTQINYFIPPNANNAFIQLGTGLGQILDSYKITNRGMGNMVIDTSQFAEGTYYYTLVINGQVVSSKKMMVAHP